MSQRITTPDMDALGELDLLAEVLAESHAGLIYARRSYSDNWALSLRGGQHCGFYIVSRGQLELRVCEKDYVLRPWDIAIVAGPHIMGTRLSAAPTPFSPSAVRSFAVEAGEGTLSMFCGAYLTDVQSHPIFGNLPPLILLRAGSYSPALDRLARLLDDELQSKAPGSRTIISRYMDAVFVSILRQWVQDDDTDYKSWLRGLGEPSLARALGLIHFGYAQPWTLDELARQAGASRAALTRRF